MRDKPKQFVVPCEGRSIQGGSWKRGLVQQPCKKRRRRPNPKRRRHQRAKSPKPIDQSIEQFAWQMRDKMTKAERILWNQLRKFGFKAQHVIRPYIVDFFHPNSKLCVEVDGGYHFTPKQQLKDGIREFALQRMGYRILRFTNGQVHANVQLVVGQILQATAVG